MKILIDEMDDGWDEKLKELGFDAFSVKKLRMAGYKLKTDYSVINYAKENKECRHNMHYWNISPYLSFGPSAHSHDIKKRWWNVHSLDKYIECLSDNKLPIEDKEILNSKDNFNCNNTISFCRNWRASYREIRSFNPWC